jgi:hypothetical protein
MQTKPDNCKPVIRRSALFRCPHAAAVLLCVTSQIMWYAYLTTMLAWRTSSWMTKARRNHRRHRRSISAAPSAPLYQRRGPLRVIRCIGRRAEDVTAHRLTRLHRSRARGSHEKASAAACQPGGLDGNAADADGDGVEVD